jgi:hypothetical protein
MDDDLKHNLTAKQTWLRGMFILLFAFFLVIARVVTGAVVVIQFLFTVFTGKSNANLRNFGASLSRYVYQCLLFLTYNSDTKPFPFEDWPASDILEGKITVEEKPTESNPAEVIPAEEPAAKPKAKSRAKAKSTTKKKTVAKKKAAVKSKEGSESETPATPDSTAGNATEGTEPGTDNKTEG